MADCKTFREEIEETTGELSDSADAHVSTCDACSVLRRERLGLRSLVGGLGRVEAPADFEFRLRARMAATRNGGRKHSFFLFRLTPRIAFVAAALCFVAVSASLYLRQERSPTVMKQANTNEVAETSHDGSGGVDAVHAVATRQNASEVVSQNSDGATASNNRVANKGRVSSRPSQRTKLARVVITDDFQNNSSDFSSGSAKVIAKQMKPIRLRTSPDTLRFVVRDENGATRPVPMRAVSFGSQELVAGVNSRVRPASNEKGGVW
jgi:hypothetical protein